MDIDFYLIDDGYVDFLKKYEKNVRGFTCVPNIHYNSREKFFYGAVMTSNNMNYFVPVSHNTNRDKNTIIITAKKKSTKDKPHEYGSLRFLYMLPVPTECLTKLRISDIEDNNRKRAVNDELAFCRRNSELISKTANKVYDIVVSGKSQKALKNSCDFKLLEKAYIEYCHANNLPLNIDSAADEQLVN